MTTEAAPTIDTMAKLLRDFIRANGKLDGAMDALDALGALTDAATEATGVREREAAYSRAIVEAQRTIRDAIKDKNVQLGGKGSYDVAETEQLLVLCREVMAAQGLALEVGDAEAVVIEGGCFARTKFGLRHRDGFVRMVTRDFPVQGAGPVFWRQTNTSALGYFLRDAFALPRRKDEGEQAAARAQSGPRRSGQASPEPAPPAAAAPAPRKITPIADVVARAKVAKDVAALDKAASWLDEQRFDTANGDGDYTDEELNSVRDAIKARREELSK